MLFKFKKYIIEKRTKLIFIFCITLGGYYHGFIYAPEKWPSFHHPGLEFIFQGMFIGSALALIIICLIEL